ncbi:glycosyltransferase [Adhaeribacter sp. BT258]|uniref:Glycosyltransferase n=1 Tax=Adhaeribacter terrigena TaxID=2793070 RepID=A0ABS1BZV5_9BACT|nr:glycosyltransferase [Adhaeribacter terrigena]MBK0402593.1 glycosyltransferase [Adhaeribacter terrigena]
MVVSVIFFIAYFSVFALVLGLWVFRKKAPETVGKTAGKVPVSILIAARNEEHTIIRCLQAIEKLDYPAELIEVLIGDDASTDQTHNVVAAYIAGKPNFKLISITGKLGQAHGKANVLAHLTKRATTGYFFITDADVAVPPGWVNAMLAAQKSGAGIVTGITAVCGQQFAERMQRLDWLNSLGLIQVVSDLNLPVSTMGNNMLVTRQAYESTGGYECIKFSVTEDIALFREVLKRGFGFKNLYEPAVLAETLPPGNWRTLLHQRKRWMQGIIYLPLIMKLVLILYASFYVFLIPLFWRVPAAVALGLLLLKWLFQSIFILVSLQKLKQRTSFKDLVLFEGYQLVITVSMLAFYFLPGKVNWKGRKY